jgi:hypothetical protein
VPDAIPARVMKAAVGHLLLHRLPLNVATGFRRRE